MCTQSGSRAPGKRLQVLLQSSWDLVNTVGGIRALNYGNYGRFLIMGNAGSISSTVVRLVGFLQGSVGGPKKGSTGDKGLLQGSWGLVLN